MYLFRDFTRLFETFRGFSRLSEISIKTIKNIGLIFTIIVNNVLREEGKKLFYDKREINVWRENKFKFNEKREERDV